MMMTTTTTMMITTKVMAIMTTLFPVSSLSGCLQVSKGPVGCDHALPPTTSSRAWVSYERKAQRTIHRILH
jgi:hypothetical protein